ncbi:MAG: hypothetical protein GC188_09600 [Alphaproteobacteria bacterium]|nr:hypothetical protein [Alphaproteobacteria bacterium]
MPHPITGESQKEFRKEFRDFLFSKVRLYRHSNIIFVCGGNDEHHLRPRFKNHLDGQHTEYTVLFPEHALEHHIGDEDFSFVDLHKMESLIGGICFCIVIFPEGPGSYAELGMFSKMNDLAGKSLVVSNGEYQGSDSFLSNGPIKLIDETSSFKPAIQLDYENPNFELIVGRIKDRQQGKFRRTYSFSEKAWSEYSDYEKLVFIVILLKYMRIASSKDIAFMIRSIGSEQVKKEELNSFIQIILGCQIADVVDLGDGTNYFYLKLNWNEFYTIQEGSQEEEALIIDDISTNIDGDNRYRELLEEATDAD